MKKSIKRAFLVFLSLFLLVGCSKSNIKQLDEEGNRIKKEYEQLQDGFWIQNKDNTFSPLCVLMEGYQGYAKESHPKRYVWFTNNNVNINSIIPIIYPGQKMIVKASLTSKVPEALSLERYKNVGYTIGVHFSLNEKGEMTMRTNNFCVSSVAGSILQKNKDSGIEDNIIIEEFNNTTNIPAKSVNKAMNMLLGLEKGGEYQLGFYIGTSYQSMNVPADTIAFQSAEVIDITENVYNKTKEGYFSVAFPQNMKEGYYIINGIGLFYYQTTEKADDNIKEQGKASEETTEEALEETLEHNNTTTSNSNIGINENK